MPHIAITMLPGRSEDIKRNLASKVRELLSKELNVDKKIISVSIEDVPLEHWEKSMERVLQESMYE